MPDVSHAQLRRLDPTLILVFLGLLRHRKATPVAADLGLTPSGVSQALRRLRDLFGDPLFLRRPHGLDPTAVALALEPALSAALEAMRQALGDRAPFDPGAERGVIRLAALDAETLAVMPGLVQRFMQTAPGLRLSVLPLARRAAMDALAEGKADLALGYFWALPDSLIAQPLWQQGYAVVGQRSVLGEEPLTPARYAALPHILVSPGGDLRGVADEALATLGLERRVIAAVPQFLPALAILAETPAVATVPETLAHRMAPCFGLAVMTPPIALRRFTVSALRHRRNAQNARLLWLVAQIATLAPGLR